MIIWKHTNSASARFHFSGEGVRFYTSLLISEEGIDIETENALFRREEQGFLCDELFLEVLNMMPQEVAKSSLRSLWKKGEEIGIIDEWGFATHPNNPMTDFFNNVCGLLQIRERGEKVDISDIRQALDD